MHKKQKELRLRNLLEGPVDLAERLDEIKKEEQVEKNSDKPEEGNTAVDATPVEQPESLASQNPNGESTNAKLSKTVVEEDDVKVEQPKDEEPEEDTKDKERSVEKHLEKPGDAITDELAEEVQEEPKDATEGVMDSIKTAEEPAAAETLATKTAGILADLAVNGPGFEPNTSWCKWTRAKNVLPYEEEELCGEKWNPREVSNENGTPSSSSISEKEEDSTKTGDSISDFSPDTVP
ncbi:unnamed protein product [Hymenolepis diminuta]|uniref:Uncharacterized protein n=1 Tax=Hymenolepis diminuta TaxID=6216 RepID=A0A0R3SDS8_HYMDI|nr:unnamed protein product [Hymenolepis diminuta]